ncbi:hypothetical protein SGFS_007140 [Streptomyces graminofaciens]|uniref:Uncharacterized protein n=1 Tax=Streptomyces graminofaciens TaxID=68212 RepID=A0ABN5V9T4_9ACTN|nr:hypothetical protein [Streptomyces graminofaciens]BBC29420.1 hypothetical protein SGFS_007140 [Streptomyces graminofaciens]
MAATERYSVLRPSDLVSLTIRSTGLQERTSTFGGTEWVATGEGSIVDLQPNAPPAPTKSPTDIAQGVVSST